MLKAMRSRKRGWEEGRDKNFDESEQKTSRKGAPNFPDTARYGGDKSFPADERAHVRFEHRVGRGEKHSRKRRHRRSEYEGEDDDRIERDAHERHGHPVVGNGAHGHAEPGLANNGFEQT